MCTGCHAQRRPWASSLRACQTCNLSGATTAAAAAASAAAWPQAYKAVCALIVHEMKQLKPAYRLKLLYVMSAILRQSKSRRGERDKYGERPGCRQRRLRGRHTQQLQGLKPEALPRGAAGGCCPRQAQGTRSVGRQARAWAGREERPLAGLAPLSPPHPRLTPCPPLCSAALCAAAGQRGRPAGAASRGAAGFSAEGARPLVV